MSIWRWEVAQNTKKFRIETCAMPQIRFAGLPDKAGAARPEHRRLHAAPIWSPPLITADYPTVTPINPPISVNYYLNRKYQVIAIKFLFYPRACQP